MHRTSPWLATSTWPVRSSGQALRHRSPLLAFDRRASFRNWLPEPPSHGKSSQPHLHHRGSVNPLSPGAPGPAARGPLPQRTLFRHASADASATAALASPHSVNQAPSSTSLASSNPSNRSSVYTVSSQSSQTSDASHFALAGHSNLGAGLPSQFSIDGGAPSPSIGLKLSHEDRLWRPRVRLLASTLYAGHSVNYDAF